MRLVNLTAHSVTIRREDGTFETIAPSDRPARVESSITGEWLDDGVRMWRTLHGRTLNLPAPEEGTMLIVSIVVRLLNPLRGDLASPAGVKYVNQPYCTALAVNHAERGS